MIRMTLRMIKFIKIQYSSESLSSPSMSSLLDLLVQLLSSQRHAWLQGIPLLAQKQCRPQHCPMQPQQTSSITASGAGAWSVQSMFSSWSFNNWTVGCRYCLQSIPPNISLIVCVLSMFFEGRLHWWEVVQLYILHFAE